MIKKIFAYFLLIATIVFNLWLYYPETQILADPNDNIFQYSLVGRTNWIWENYGCPFSLSCLPNLLDHNVPNWAEGYPLPFYYSHVPQIATVASYHLIIRPLSLIANSQSPITLHQYYNWTKYLLLTFFPLSVFFALRLVGFSPILAALGAFLGANFSTDGLYGIDPPSYLWRGYGLASQLYALIFLPLGIAFTYRLLKVSTENDKNTPGVAGLKDTPGAARRVYPERDSPGVKELENGRPSKFSTSGEYFAHPRGVLTTFSILFLTLTTAGHLGIGIIGLLSTLPFLFLDFKVTNIIARFKKLFLILASCFLILSYWIIPILLNNNYHIISFWDPIWKFNSYGWYEVIKQLFNGEIFDWQRFPILTILTVIGFFVLSIRQKYLPFALLFAFWFLMYFGRTTWGGLIDLIPGMKDFHQHRFVVGIHVAALFLIPAGLEWLFAFISNIIRQLADQISKIHIKNNDPGSNSRRNDPGSSRLEDPQIRTYYNITFYIFIFTFISLLIYFTAKQTVAYATLNNKWIYQANDAYRYDEANFKNLLSQIDSLPAGRLYAGRPGNWGKGYRLGSTQLYLLLGGIGYDISQFLPETWSPMSENEQDFDEREALDYDLLNIRYVVVPKNEGFAPSVKLADKFGPFELYKAPTTGWFDVVTSPMLVKSDKTNYINLVHLWWRSYPRRWKMNPLISVDKNPNIPQGMQKIITMTDEVSYQESDKVTPGVAGIQSASWRTMGGGDRMKNIFSDFPFVFPEATVSAYLKESAKDTPAENTPGVAGLKETPGVAKAPKTPPRWRGNDLDSSDGGGISNNTAIIFNEKVYKQTYSATIDVPDNCKQCMIMFKMSYHPDWEAELDGKPATKFAVFPFYLAVQATPGAHTVEFTYKPNSLKVFLLVLELFALIFLLSYIIRKSRRFNIRPTAKPS